MSNLLHVVKNKYFIVTCFFLIWIGFFDQNDWVTRKAIDNEIKKLKDDKEFFTTEVIELQKEELRLKENEEELEKYARENFYMKKQGEDVYVIVEE
ncbi:MAG: septum formation initiator family protein [Bacteroidia bacterium]